ncbi:prominin-1-like [Montipora foliosa]|uniref:prominin-1-like n=1 Tax=Montipora foliosa TaxID=591990 RepID=UPI0035F21B9A
MKIVLSLCFFVLLQNTDSGARSNEEQNFPEGKPYNLQGSEDDKWSLNGLSNVADSIALLLREDPPYDIIGDFMSQAFGTGGKSPTASEVVDYEVPFIVLGSFAILAALIIPIVGVVFCSCRHAGRCGGSSVDDGESEYPMKERIAYSVGILLCAFFLLLAAGFIFTSSVKMSDSIPHTRVIWKESFSDIQIFKENFFQELDYILLHEAIPRLGELINYVIAISVQIIEPIFKEPSFEELFHAVLETYKAMLKMLYLFVEMDKTVASLVVKTNEINNELNTAQENLTAAMEKCKQKAGAQTAQCNEIPSGGGLETEANFTKVPNITVEENKIKEVAKTNLTEAVIKGNESIQGIVGRVQNLTSNLTTEFKNFSSKIEDLPDSLSKPLLDSIDKLLKDTLYPLRDDVDNNYIGSDGTLTKYDTYRHIVFIIVATLTLLVVLLLLIAVSLGLIGARKHDTPSSRSSISDWGGRLMMGVAGLLFFAAFVVNLMTGILFLLGSNVAVVCNDLPDYKLLEKTIDDPNIMGEYVLAKLILKNGRIPLTTSGILRQCSKNRAPWEVVKMDNIFNLSDAFQYKDKIPSKEEVFAGVNDTIVDTSILSEKASKALNDSIDAGVHNIDFAKYFEEINKPVVLVPLDQYAANVSKASKNLKPVSPDVSQMLDLISMSLSLLYGKDVRETRKKMEYLRELATQLQREGNVVLNNGGKAQKAYKKASSFIRNDALDIVAKGIVTHWDIAFSHVDEFLAKLIKRVRFDLGRCKPLPNIYHGLTGSLCKHYAAGMNAAWVAFGLDALVLLICIVLCVRASKHFRRASAMQEIDEPDSEGEVVVLKMVHKTDSQQLVL